MDCSTIWTGIFFSHRYSLYFYLIFAHLWWFGGVGVLGSCIGFLGLGSLVDGFGPVEWGLLAFFGSGLST